MKEAWTLERGANVDGDRGVQFSVWAPNAKRVRVRIVRGAAAGEHELHAGTNEGVFETIVRDARAGDDYAFLLDDREQPLPDPVSRWQPEGVHGASRVVDPASFRWRDDHWLGIAMQDLTIYEIHIGIFTPQGTFAAAIPFLRGLRRELGVTAIEIMPVAQFPGTRNWGYDGVELYAVQASYGGPDGLKQLVDAAHAEGLAVILDVVYNHVGPEGNYLPLYGPYFTEKYKTPWGPALNYDDAASDEVRRFIVDNARYWITEYHVDGLRLDAVHGIFDFSARHLLQEIVEEVHAQAGRLGRHVVVIGESDLNDPKLIRPIDKYGYGLDAQWSDDFHHAVHAALTGEDLGYYADFGSTTAIADALREPFVYDGGYSRHRKRRHGGSSDGLAREKFVVAIQNHDQVGNRATGDRLSTLLAPDQLRLAAALLLLSPYVPLLFMGEEYGETNPFLYFVSHGDAELVDAVRTGRRREFEAFGWGDEVPDPQSDETFQRSMLDRDKLRKPEHARVFALYRDLLALRDKEPLLRPDASTLRVDRTAGCISLLRTPRATASDHEHALLALFNCTAEPVEVPLPDETLGRWTLRLSTDDATYGGAGRLDEVGGGRGEGGGMRPEAHADSGSWRDGQTTETERDDAVSVATAPRESRRNVTVPPWCAALYVASP